MWERSLLRERRLPVDGEIEQREIANPSADLQADTDGPDLVSLQWGLLARDVPFILRRLTWFVGQ